MTKEPTYKYDKLKGWVIDLERPWTTITTTSGQVINVYKRRPVVGEYYDSWPSPHPLDRPSVYASQCATMKNIEDWPIWENAYEMRSTSTYIVAEVA